MIVCAVVFAVILINYCLNNRHFDITEVTLRKRWVQKCFRKYSMNIVYNEYTKKGKSTVTKKGEYRAAYLNDVEKRECEIIRDCFCGEHFNKEFCNFIQKNYPNARIKDFYYIINNFRKHENMRIQQNFNHFLEGSETVSPKEFFELRKKQNGDIVGVYIIYNKTKNLYYVGQAKKLFSRIYQHFTGHGNGDVYADYKYGDEFVIKIVRLTISGYDDIDLLEKDLIKRYNAYSHGYNKTSGNS